VVVAEEPDIIKCLLLIDIQEQSGGTINQNRLKRILANNESSYGTSKAMAH
jgi:hypothetical protein